MKTITLTLNFHESDDKEISSQKLADTISGELQNIPSDELKEYIGTEERPVISVIQGNNDGLYVPEM